MVTHLDPPRSSYLVCFASIRALEPPRCFPDARGSMSVARQPSQGRPLILLLGNNCYDTKVSLPFSNPSSYACYVYYPRVRKIFEALAFNCCTPSQVFFSSFPR